MALGVVGQGQHGEVIVTDTRENGAIVVLFCYEGGPVSSGVSLRPEPADKNKESGGFPWPTEGHSQRLAMEQMGAQLPDPGAKPFKLTVDISGLPRGANYFALDRFTDTALHIGPHVDEVALGPDNAAEWGLVSQ